ncbi:MAG TPA: two-component regulator propeller domain-containing protein [Puia sp.]|uniref:two-component regulator propeller domain-containing protein n=1 Tax=Puia sp. TaxID=2045100 RepID=UPI002CBC37DE|nr:two-component regulator propeller domain-containing protein [Puia sp.]HVU99559.1 two-component regulator propeller domain-containing protein [Puia sp.]
MTPYRLLFLLLQAISLSALGQIDGLTLKHIGTDAGLSQTNVTCILQDKIGFMWFGTRDGLNRYDGYNFTVYRNREEEKHSLTNNFVTTLIEDRNGDIWVGTWGGGVNRFDRRTKTFNLVDSAFANAFVNHILQDSEGNIWICTDGEGLYKIDPITGKHKCFYADAKNPAGLGDLDIYTIFEDSRHEYWVGTANGGLYSFDGKTDKFTNYAHNNADPSSLCSNAVKAIYEDAGHRLWIATLGGGLDLMTDRKGAFKHFFSGKPSGKLKENMIQALAGDADGNLWVGTDNGGLVIIGPTGDRYKIYYQDDIDNSSLSNNSVDCIYKDKQGNMWLGTYGAGANLFARGNDNFRHYRHSTEPGSLSNNNVLDIFEDSRDNLWVGTDGGGIDLLDKKTGQFRHFTNDPARPGGLSGNYVLALREDSHGNLWAGTWGGGITVIDPTKTRFTQYRNIPGDSASIASNNVYDLATGKDGRIWIGTYGQGLDRFDEAKHQFIHHRHDPADDNTISSDRVHALLADTKGIIWVGTFDRGLDRYDPRTDRFTHYRHETRAGSLSNNSINCIYEDSTGDIWIGTAEGLNRLDHATGRFTNYSTKDGLPGSVIYGVLQENNGVFWISTNKGLSKFMPAQHRIITYTADDGLQANDFKAHSAFRSRDGKMYFGGVNGFNAFYPDSIRENTVDPNLVITGFQIFNREVAVSTDPKHPSPLTSDITETKELKLDYNNSVITIEFASLNYTAPGSRRYRYRLEGFDKDWTNTSRKRTVTYTNLDPGTYTFMVNARKGDGTWLATPTTLRLVIIPPFWMTTWFRVLAALALVALVLLIHGLRLRNIRLHRSQLQQQVQERTAQLTLSNAEERKAREQAELASKAKSEFLANMSHELRTPLNAIIGFTDLVLSTSLQQTQREYIEHVSRAGYNLLGLINAVLDFSKIEAGKLLLEDTEFNLAHLVEETVSMLAIKGFEKGLEMICEIDPRLPSLFRGDSLRIQQILVNLIGNAIKFTAKGEVVVRVKKEDSICIHVQDTGIGIPADKLDTIFESFTQGDSSTTRKYGGTGLGLTIAKTLAEMMHGRLSVKSKPGEGTTFSLCIDLPVVSEAPVPQPMRRPALRNILIVDDNASNCRLLQDIFRQMDVDCVTATSGQEALNVLATHRRQDRSFDLIITDYQMPGMDGIALVREIKTLLTGPAQPFILMLSSIERNIYREEAKDIGIDMFLTKPVLVDQLNQILAGIFEERNRPKAESNGHDHTPVHIREQSIMVVEDDAINMLLISEVLGKMGFPVIGASNGKEALDRLVTTTPCLIFMDINMPEMDGFEATRRIRELPAPKCDIPVVALTADAMKEDRERCLAAGMNNFLAKPFRLEEVKALLETYAPSPSFSSWAMKS